MRKHHSALGGVALALALTLTGCSDDGSNAPDATDTPTATPSETPTSASPTTKTPQEKAAPQLQTYLADRDATLRPPPIDFKTPNKETTVGECLTPTSETR